MRNATWDQRTVIQTHDPSWRVPTTEENDHG